MDAQAAAQKMAAQQAAQAAIRGASAAAAAAAAGERPESPIHISASVSDEPTDLSMDALRARERLERERYFAESRATLAGLAAAAKMEERDREEIAKRPKFDFRHLIPAAAAAADGDN